MKERYRQVALDAIGSQKINIQCGACPDQYVGSIANFNDTPGDFPFRKPVMRLDNCQSVVLILESPHKKEFIGEWGPAKGSTGTQIRKHIAQIIKDADKQFSGLSELILVNAIQYQCSLGMDTRQYRDKVFRDLWERGGAEDFKRRLKQLYRQGDMLMNCCTGGKSRLGLRQLVTDAIHNSLGEVPLYSGPHPCSWFSERNRRSIGQRPASASNLQ